MDCLTSEEIFESVKKELNNIKDIIEKNQNLSPIDVAYVIHKIVNRVEDIQTDMELYVRRVQEESNIGKPAGID